MNWDSVVAVCALAAPLLPIGLGVGLAACVLWRVAEGRRAARWRAATGTVLDVGNRGAAPGGGSRQVLVLYSYAVGEQTYEGTRIHPAYWASPFEAAHAALEAVLVPGRQVRVYYRADSPATSTLSVGLFSGTLGLAFGGLACAALGAGLLIAAAFAWQDGGWDTPGSRAGVSVAVFGFLAGCALALLFGVKGNWDFAAGITVEENPPDLAGGERGAIASGTSDV
jgi:hypothetical protein